MRQFYEEKYAGTETFFKSETKKKKNKAGISSDGTYIHFSK